MEHLRKCVSCGEFKPREDMIKITKEYLTENVVVNPNSKTFGRSAYLCYNQTCIVNALKKNRLGRALKTSQELKGLFIDGESSCIAAAAAKFFCASVGGKSVVEGAGAGR